MGPNRAFVLSGAALSLAFGLAACGGGMQEQAPVATAAPQPAPEYWDPKAPRAGAQAGDDWGDDNDY